MAIQHQKTGLSGSGKTTHKTAKFGSRVVKHKPSTTLGGGVHRPASEVPASPGTEPAHIGHRQGTPSATTKIKHNQVVVAPDESKVNVTHNGANLQVADGVVMPPESDFVDPFLAEQEKFLQMQEVVYGDEPAEEHDDDDEPEESSERGEELDE